VPAFITVSGAPAEARTVNTEGLRRRGFSAESMSSLRRAFRILYRQGLTLEIALQRLESLSEDCIEVAQLVQSINQSQRGIVR
jgi:UDP-N-acetylglucosamine acyltransferase